MKISFRKIDRAKALYFTFSVVLAALFLSFSYYRVFDEYECSTLDLRYRLRPAQKVDRNIVIIEISDDSIERIGQWPFPRNYHALLVQALKAAGARTVIFDIFFSEAKDGDEGLADVVKDAGNVYMPYVFELEDKARESAVPEARQYAADLLGIFRKAARNTGFINVILDGDGTVRRVPSVIEYENKLYPHISLRVALDNLGYSFEDVKFLPGDRMMIGDIVIPLGAYSSIMVNYPDDWEKSFRHYSYFEIIQSYLADVTKKEPIIELEELKDAVCFIGFTATASPDAHPSPFHPQYPGIGVHTSLYNSVINKSFLRRPGPWLNLAILILMWSLTALVTSRARKNYAIAYIVALMLAFSGLAIALFWPFGLWIDMFYPLVTMMGIYVVFTFRKYVVERQKRELIEKELDIAKNIQRSFLPSEMPEVGGIKISAKMITARQVGGDLYDLVKTGDRKLGVMLGDVSGKGVPAALYMAKVVSVFKTFVNEGEVDDVVRKINERLVSESGTNLFVTLTFTVFDTEKNTATYAIGGHLPTIVVDPDGLVELLNVEEGMPLGMIESVFSKGVKTYKPGSTFIFYSDGVTEAMDTGGDMFGERRLLEVARTLKGKSAEEAVETIQKAVSLFAGRAPQHDDITVLAVTV